MGTRYSHVVATMAAMSEALVCQALIVLFAILLLDVLLSLGISVHLRGRLNL